MPIIRKKPVQSRTSIRKENEMTEYFEELAQKPIRAQVFSLLKKIKSSELELAFEDVLRHKASSILLRRDRIEIENDEVKFLSMKTKKDRYEKWFDDMILAVKKEVGEQLANKFIAALSPDYAAFLASNVEGDTSSKETIVEDELDPDEEDELDPAAKAILAARSLQSQLSADAGKVETAVEDNEEDEDEDDGKPKKKSNSEKVVNDQDNDESSSGEEDWDTEEK